MARRLDFSNGTLTINGKIVATGFKGEIIESKKLSAKPICDVCDRPIETLHEAEDDFLERTVFTAHCHGETERVTISWKESEMKGLEFGRAFIRPKLRLPGKV